LVNTVTWDFEGKNMSKEENNKIKNEKLKGQPRTHGTMKTKRY
jgi:hypothetical protein